MLLQRIKRVYVALHLHFAGSMDKANIYNKYYGVNIGSNVRIMGKPDFGSEPYLITLGNNVTVTEGVVFVTHDGGVGLFRDEYKGINVFAEVIVGDNVFIGINSIILPGVTIGDNVVIGAGSIVTKNIPDNVVVAGAPAKQVKTIQEYKQSCLDKAVYVFSEETSKRKNEILNAINIK